jgi:Fic family protein
MLLGECQSKCEHIAGVPLKSGIADELHRVYLAKGALATTAIEGNTLSEEEVLKHLDGKLRLPPSRGYLQQEIDNIVQGCNGILKDIKAGKPPNISALRIKQLNRIVLTGLKLEEGVIPGEIRVGSVGVARYRAAPAEDCELLLERLCSWLNSEEFKPSGDTRIAYAVLKAVLSHVYLAWIHPFGDGNGRTARLLEFQILIASGVPAPAAHLLSNHYNQTRTEYYRQLDSSSRSGGDVLPFVTYAVSGFVEGLRSQLEYIRLQQWEIAWHDFVHETFGGKSSPSDVRRRHLILDLSAQSTPVSFAKLREMSPRIAVAYASKTDKTLSRDLNALGEMGLLLKTPDGMYQAKKEVILAFLPARATAQENA